MKKNSILLFLLVLTGFAKAQDCLREISGGGCIVVENDNYGIKKKGKYIVPARYEQIADHSGLYFSVEEGGKWGLYDNKGNMVLPTAYNKINAIDAAAGLIVAEGNGYNNLVITDKLSKSGSTTKANPFLVVSWNEVTVGEYLNFMADLDRSKFDYTSKEAFPDTTKMGANARLVFGKFYALKDIECEFDYEVFRKITTIQPLIISCDLYKDKKLREYLDLPMSGINLEQANEYCKWLTKRFNEHFTADQPYELVIRLPKPGEWDNIAQSGLNADMQVRGVWDSLNIKKCMLFNYKFKTVDCENIQERLDKFGHNETSVLSYFPDNNGLYALFGNVAEMTSEKGVAKGGSYMHYARESAVGKQQKYDGAQPWLGFRWVTEYKLKK